MTGEDNVYLKFVTSVINKISNLILAHNNDSNAHSALKNAIISQSITNGDTTHAPSADAVYDALSLKQDSNSAFSGAYSDLTGKPTIPTDVSDLTDTNNTTFTPKSHSHGLTDVTDTSTVEVVVTYTDSSTDTLNLVVYDED